MATMQYIGARYVPRFSDPLEWQENLTYEPLTIVTRSGNSYTSKKSVPAGIDPFTNAEYWACTGNYNAQLDDYREAVAQISTELGQIKTEFSGVKTEFADLKNKVNNNKLTFVDVPFPPSAFLADSTYPGYNYRATMADGRIAATMIPEVVFSPADANGGNLCPVANTFDGGLYIYAEAVPGDTVTVPLIVCWR